MTLVCFSFFPSWRVFPAALECFIPAQKIAVSTDSVRFTHWRPQSEKIWADQNVVSFSFYCKLSYALSWLDFWDISKWFLSLFYAFFKCGLDTILSSHIPRTFPFGYKNVSHKCYVVVFGCVRRSPTWAPDPGDPALVGRWGGQTVTEVPVRPGAAASVMWTGGTHRDEILLQLIQHTASEPGFPPLNCPDSDWKPEQIDVY